MEKQQKLEWAEAQKITISIDLVAAAKQQLKFLAAVDKNRHLYAGPALEKAIYRYKYFWLPLLAKHAESQFLECLLVVPLDCEWIWHCHRLNPLRYRMDCVERYGRTLDNRNVVSSVQGPSKKQTEEIWNMMYPNEPYELNLNAHFQNGPENKFPASGITNYDLVSAVKRQSPFYFQVSRPGMNDDLFLEGAVERYKGFLHLIKRNTENKMKQFCVPTYDIDLIWHSHQLHPVSYCKDLITVLGKVLDHNDMDSDRTKGEKLNVGFTETTKQWEETFGSRYWRAGAMYRGSAPSPLVTDVFSFETLRKEVIPSIDFENTMQLPQKMLVEIFLEIVGVRNLPAGHKGSLFVSVSKSQPDVFFKTKRRLIIMSSEPGEKQVIAFHCEPTGELAFELVSYYSPSSLHTTSSPEILGTTSIPIQDLLNPISKLRIEKWFDLVATTTSQVSSSQSIGLRVALSLTAPIQAPYLLHMVRGHPFSTTSSFPLPQRVQLAKSWMCIIDEAGNEIISIQMRDTNKSEANSNGTFKKEIIGLTRSGETRLLAELLGEKWYLIGSQWSLQVQKKISEEDSTFELIGSRKMTIFQGRKLEYETKDCKRKKNERDFMTIVEFSNEDPYGKAVALLDLKSGFLKVEEQWFALPGITIAFILSGILMKEGYGKPEDDCVCSGECDNRNGTIKKAFLTREYEWTGASACGGGCGGSCGGSCGGACRGGSCGGGRCGGGCKS